MKKTTTKILSVLLVSSMILSAFMITNKAKADTFYKTFMSLCEGQEWFISFVNAKFIENGQRFSDLTSENDPILLNITEMMLPSSGITEIPEAVKYFKNLAYVDLSYNDIEDVSALYNCPYIMYLKMDGNRIKNIELSGFADLTTVSIADNLLEEMPLFTANTKIKYIDLSHNNITKLTSLEGLKNITELNLGANAITSTAGLGSFTMSVENGDAFVDLSYNSLRTIDSIGNIKNAITLDISHNFVSIGLGGISNDTVTLDISYNAVSDAGGLAGKTNLRNLDISHNGLTTVDNFNTCVNLVSLNLGSNKIKNINGLDGFKNVESLNMSNNGLTDMPLCTTLTKLKYLDLSDNSISSFALVNRYESLVYLNASNNLVTEFSGINTLKNLVYADFSYNKIEKVYAKLYLTTPSLKVLKLSGNNLSASEVKNVFANGYSEIWLEDIDLSGKLPDMSLYPKIKELYMSGSKLNDADIANVFRRNDYTGLGLGGIIDDTVRDELKKQTNLITLDLDKTLYVSEYFDFLSELGILELSISECGLTELSTVLFTGKIKNIDCSDNNIEKISDEILSSAVMNGVLVDFSGNKITENRMMYLYVESIGYDFKDNYLDINADRKLTFSNNVIKCEVGQIVDIYSYLRMTGIYDGIDIEMISAKNLEIKLVKGKSSSVAIDSQTLKVEIKKAVSILEDLTLEVSVKGNRRDEYTAKVTLYTAESPVIEDVVDGVNVIYGIELGTTYEALLKSYGFDESYKTEAFYFDGSAADMSDLVGTGAVIRVTDIDTGKVVYEKTAVIFGDCNGNGKINSTDIMLIKRHIFNQSKLTGVYFFAADVYQNGVINSTDFMLVKRHIFKQSFISQTGK